MLDFTIRITLSDGSMLVTPTASEVELPPDIAGALDREFDYLSGGIVPLEQWHEISMIDAVGLAAVLVAFDAPADGLRLEVMLLPPDPEWVAWPMHPLTVSGLPDADDDSLAAAGDDYRDEQETNPHE